MRIENNFSVGNPTDIIKEVVVFRQILVIRSYVSTVAIRVMIEAMIKMIAVSGLEIGRIGVTMLIRGMTVI